MLQLVYILRQLQYLHCLESLCQIMWGWRSVVCRPCSSDYLLLNQDYQEKEGLEVTSVPPIVVLGKFAGSVIPPTNVSLPGPFANVVICVEGVLEIAPIGNSVPLLVMLDEVEHVLESSAILLFADCNCATQPYISGH